MKINKKLSGRLKSDVSDMREVGYSREDRRHRIRRGFFLDFYLKIPEPNKDDPAWKRKVMYGPFSRLLHCRVRITAAANRIQLVYGDLGFFLEGAPTLDSVQNRIPRTKWYNSKPKT